MKQNTCIFSSAEHLLLHHPSNQNSLAPKNLQIMRIIRPNSVSNHSVISILDWCAWQGVSLSLFKTDFFIDPLLEISLELSDLENDGHITRVLYVRVILFKKDHNLSTTSIPHRIGTGIQRHHLSVILRDFFWLLL